MLPLVQVGCAFCAILVLRRLGSSALEQAGHNCDRAWNKWSDCDAVSGMQHRTNFECNSLIEIRECAQHKDCGDFSPWEPPDTHCLEGKEQRRTRHGCPLVEEIRICKLDPEVCTPPWGPWSKCGPTCLQERRNEQCSLVEVRECNDCQVPPGGPDASCGAWENWNPPKNGAFCTPSIKHERSRSGCPHHKEVQVCLPETWQQCDPKAACNEENAPCLCGESYEGEEVVCVQANPCDSNAKCVLEGASKKCKCEPGFRKDADAGNAGHPCVEEDECQDQTHSCKPPAVCVKIPGSYTCNCPPGTTLTIQGTCTETDNCTGVTCPEGSTCVSNEQGYSCSPSEEVGESSDVAMADIEEHALEGFVEACTSRDASGACGKTKGSFRNPAAVSMLTVDQMPCPIWGIWSPCEGNVRSTRTCLNDRSLIEYRLCPTDTFKDCGSMGEWSECSVMPPSSRKRHAEKFDGDCLTAFESQLCPLVNNDCGEWSSWTTCGIPSKDLQMKILPNCRYAEYSACLSEIGQSSKADFCTIWTPWTQCYGNDSRSNGQTRECLSHPELSEERGCHSCGGWSPWSECQNYLKSQNALWCPDLTQTKLCNVGKECGDDGIVPSKHGKCDLVVGETVYMYRLPKNCGRFHVLPCDTKGSSSTGHETESVCTPWSTCESRIQTRWCDESGSLESRSCVVGPDNRSCGKWTKYDPFPCGGLLMPKRTRKCSDGIDFELMSCSSVTALPKTEFEWEEWSDCNVLIDGQALKSRTIKGHNTSEWQFCAISEISAGSVVCSPWQECKNKVTERICEVRNTPPVCVKETLECRYVEWEEWSKCSNRGSRIRYEKNNHVHTERVQCGSENCSAFGAWTECNSPVSGLRIRLRSPCDKEGPCYCSETELCDSSDKTSPVQHSMSLTPIEEPPTGSNLVLIIGIVAAVCIFIAATGFLLYYFRFKRSSTTSPSYTDQIDDMGQRSPITQTHGGVGVDVAIQ